MSHSRKIGKPVIKPRGLGFQARVRVGGLGGKPKDFYGQGPTEHEAVAAAVKQAHAWDPGLVTVTGKNIPFVEYLEDFHRSNDKINQRTRETYLDRIDHHVVPVLKETPIDRVTWGDFQRLKNTMATKGAGANTILGVFRLLNKPIEIAVQRRMLKENPLLTISLPAGVSAPRTPLTQAQLLHLLELTKDSFWSDHLHVLAATGMRVAELMGLQWGDMHLGTNPTATVRQQAHDARYGLDARLGAPKTKSSGREIALPADTAERLRQRWERWLQPGADRLVFPNTKGEIQDPASLRHFLATKAASIGVKSLHPHLLRHTMISHALQITGDLGGVSAMAGHSNPKITAGVYLKGLPGAGRSIAKAMGTLISADRDQI